jgi:hypothetical protein
MEACLKVSHYLNTDLLIKSKKKLLEKGGYVSLTILSAMTIFCTT